MRQLIKRLLVLLTSNTRSQRFLERSLIVCLGLMGIGKGSSPESSGERALVNKLKKGAPMGQSLCIFDVGANRGRFLQMIEHGLQRVTLFHVYAFEPCQYTYQLLCKNAEGYSNVTLNNLGLGKQAGEFELFYDMPGSGLASLSRRRLDHFGIDFKYSERVRIDTIDEYCRLNSIQIIDLLKLDVEGHELDVLRGGQQMFSKGKIKMVSFEFGGCNIDARTYFQDLYYFFKENGMNKIFRITPSGFLMPIFDYKEIYEQFITTNFVACQSETC